MGAGHQRSLTFEDTWYWRLRISVKVWATTGEIGTRSKLLLFFPTLLTLSSNGHEDTTCSPSHRSLRGVDRNLTNTVKGRVLRSC